MTSNKRSLQSNAMLPRNLGINPTGVLEFDWLTAFAHVMSLIHILMALRADLSVDSNFEANNLLRNQ